MSDPPGELAPAGTVIDRIVARTVAINRFSSAEYSVRRG